VTLLDMWIGDFSISDSPLQRVGREWSRCLREQASNVFN